MNNLDKKDIGEVLQRLYDSEIHIRIGWLWDGGVDYVIGADSPYIWGGEKENNIRGTGEDNIVKALEILCQEVVEAYPKSSFATWYRGKQIISKDKKLMNKRDKLKG